MPIPFLVAGAIAATAATGIGTGVKATKNNKEAKSVNSEASDIVEKAEESLNNNRKKANAEIERLGEEKIIILSTTIKDFLSLFQLLKNVEFDDSTIGIDELKNIGVSKDLLGDLETQSFDAVKIASGGLASLGTGVAAAYGAYTGTMALGTASTGAAISGLSGVAASNATLAWLGGGALSAGGYGVAGGALVLGGVVAGPALAVGGLIMSAQSKKKLNAAYENLAEAKTIKEEMANASSILQAIQKRSKQIREFLMLVDLVFEDKVEEMKRIISSAGTNWDNFERQQREEIHKAFLLAQIIKGILDTPLLDEDGAITEKSAEMLQTGRSAFEKIRAQRTQGDEEYD